MGALTCSNAAGAAAHLAVGGDDRGLAVAVAPAAVVRLDEVHGQLLGEHLALRARAEAALVEANLDALVERRVRAVGSRVLGGESATCGGTSSAGSTSTSRSTSAGSRAASSKASRPPNECPTQTGGSLAERREQRVHVAADVPRRLPRRVAVPEQVGRLHVEARCEPCREPRRSGGRGP